MTNISDIIEEFILEQLEGSDNIYLSRNELASFFSCAPSQINYVLSTRFTMPKGYMIESHRGGGGYIKLFKVNYEKNDYVERLIGEVLSNDIDYQSAIAILDNLYKMDIFTDKQCKILKSAISPKALAMPVKIENRLRSNIMRSVLINYLRGE